MALPTDLRPASYRGVSFFARETGYEGGRQTAVYEYPEVDEPEVDDLRRATRRWTLQAFLVGADVRADKRRLIAACEAAGPGLLVHPTEGSLTVQCETVSVSESTDGVNTAEFSLSFIERGSTLAPVALTSSQTTVADELRSAVRDFYAARMQVRSVARKVTRLLTGTVEERCCAVLELGGLMSGDDVTTLTTAVRVLADTYETGEMDGEEYAAAWQDAFGSLDEPEALERYTASLGERYAASAAALEAGAETETDAQVLSNAYTLDLLLYTSSLTRQTEVAAETTYAAYDDALDVLERISARLIALEPQTATDAATYAALGDCRRTLADAIVTESLDLPRVREFDLDGPTPAVVLAYDLYGDASRAVELIERNGIHDPNTVTGAVRVLTE